MGWATALALLLIGQAQEYPGKAIMSDDQAAWVAEHAPYGFDIFPDGTIWVSAGENKAGTTYGLLLDDMMKANGVGATVWLRSDHRRDKTVPYRESKTRLYFDCPGKRYQEGTWISYRADGEVYSQQSRTYVANGHEDIIPGTMAELWWKLACWQK